MWDVGGFSFGFVDTGKQIVAIFSWSIVWCRGIGLFGDGWEMWRSVFFLDGWAIRGSR